MLATFAETATGMLALALVVAPGVLLAAWFFPDERPLWHLAVGGVLGIALAGAVALAVSYTPAGLTPRSAAGSFLALNAASGALFIVSRREALRRRPGWLRALRSLRGVRREGALSALLVLVLVLAFVAALPRTLRGRPESYTEFSLLDAASDAAPWHRPVAVADPVFLTLAVTSHERGAQDFAVRVAAGDDTIQMLDLGTLQPGERVERLVTLPPRANPAQRYELLLRKGRQEAAYRSLFVWIKAPGAFPPSPAGGWDRPDGAGQGS